MPIVRPAESPLPAPPAAPAPAPTTAVPAPTSGRDRILDEAAELFLTRGYGDTSLRDIASAVGIRPASIYHHFASKEELFTAILRIGIRHTTEAFDAVASERIADSTADEILLAHVEAHLGALFDHRPYTAANIVVFPVAPRAVKTTVVPIRDDYEKRWDALLQELTSTKQLNPNLDLPMARRIVLGSINSTIEWFNPDEADPDKANLDEAELMQQDDQTPTRTEVQTVSDLARTMTDLVWKGIGL